MHSKHFPSTGCSTLYTLHSVCPTSECQNTTIVNLHISTSLACDVLLSGASSCQHCLRYVNLTSCRSRISTILSDYWRALGTKNVIALQILRSDQSLLLSTLFVHKIPSSLYCSTNTMVIALAGLCRHQREHPFPCASVILGIARWQRRRLTNSHSDRSSSLSSYNGALTCPCPCPNCLHG